MRPKRYPYQKNKLIIQSKNAKTKIELDSGKITINADAIVTKDDLTHDESYNSNIACFERMQQKLKSIYGTSEIISETIGQDKKPTETVDFRISRLEKEVEILKEHLKNTRSLAQCAYNLTSR
ncbi:hypothetical protein [Streptococcus dysgalactiae]|uniref:hypothetical protein n=1 Tax=Streptococcus dysgalactiae TaxID=1334 RepID=UPI0024B784E8|nr:hypothetical protein [Streptococcus dysgalactiae]